MGDATTGSKSKRRLGGFELISKVGRGGMGTVYKAMQLSMNRIVAVKILYPRLAADRAYIERFSREAQAAASLNHRNIVQGIDAGEASGYYYFAMEFVDGETVHQMITREGALEERLALTIIKDISHALSHAHRYGIVHRDIKPGNIMVTRGGVTKLCDLGLAQPIVKDRYAAQRTGTAVGTPYYISPEQARGEGNIDIRSDIYSLGATFYRMVVGEVPFDAPTPAEILRKHIRDPLPWPRARNPRVSDHVGFLIAKMMAKDSNERYKSPAELVQDLDRVLAGEAPALVGFKFDIPEDEADPEAQAASRERTQKKRETVKMFVEVREAAAAAIREQGRGDRDLVEILRGNLDDNDYATHLKYGVLLLAEKRFRRARSEFIKAAKLGADTSGYMPKIQALGAPPGMTYVAAGEVTLGAPDNSDRRTVEVPAFFMDVTPVTNAQYADFMKKATYPAPPSWPGGKVPAGKGKHPVTDVSWDDARNYALFAGKRLPTEEEWERTARSAEGRIWPWGMEFEAANCNSREADIGDTTPAGRFVDGGSPFGCLDMAGNVWEWTSSNPSPEETEGEARDLHVIRGGSYKETGENVCAYVRQWLKRDARGPDIGFRCARDC